MLYSQTKHINDAEKNGYPGVAAVFDSEYPPNVGRDKYGGVRDAEAHTDQGSPSSVGLRHDLLSGFSHV